MDGAGNVVIREHHIPACAETGSAGYRPRLFPVLIHSKWAYIDRSGTVVIPPGFFDARFFSEGLAAVQMASSGNDRWGYIDSTGTMVIEPRYAQAGNFRGGLVKVYLENASTGQGREQYLDRSGQLIWDFGKNE